MGGPGSGKQRKRPSPQALAERLIAHGGSAEDTAEEFGIAPRTMREWMSRPEYQEVYEQRLGGVVVRALSALATQTPRAAEILIEIAESGEPADRVRLDAAKEVLRVAGQAVESMKLDARLADMEKRLAGLGGSGPASSQTITLAPVVPE